MPYKITSKKKGQPKQHVLTVRITEELEKKIRQNAESSKRSITEELTLRLEQSLDRNAARTTSFLDLIRTKIGDVELQTKQSWLEDEQTWRILRDWLVDEIDRRNPTNPTNRT